MWKNSRPFAERRSMPFFERVRIFKEIDFTGTDKDPLAWYFKALFSNVALVKPRNTIKKKIRKNISKGTFLNDVRKKKELHLMVKLIMRGPIYDRWGRTSNMCRVGSKVKYL